MIFQPEAVIKESDLNRSLKSELHVRPIHPPSAMQAKHIFDSTMRYYQKKISLIRFKLKTQSRPHNERQGLAFLLHWFPKKQVLKWDSKNEAIYVQF